MAFFVQRGTNISHWLSQSQRRGAERQQWFAREDVQWIANNGFDHIRLPVDEEQMFDEAGNPESEAFDLLHAALDWCEEAGLHTIVDFHILRSHHFLDVEPPLFHGRKEPQRFAGLWRELSKAMRGRSTDKVAFELMNEPVATNNADWNRVAKVVYDALRKEEPEATGRTIFLGSNRWNSVATFDELWVPKDQHLMLTFHYYSPLLVTHYQAPWHQPLLGFRGPIRYPGKPVAEEEIARLREPLKSEVLKENRDFSAALMESDLAKPLAVKARTGCPLYCGEFGVLDTVSDSIRIAWYRDLISVFDRNDIAWANWDYKGSFAVAGPGRVPTAVLQGLMGP